MYPKRTEMGVRTALTILVVAGMLLLGWVLNVVKFVRCDFQAPYKAEIVRAVGIPLWPLGGVLGWIKISDEKKE